MKPKVYIEATIPSYLVARPTRNLIVAAHQQVTRQWWLERRDRFDLFISQFVVNEAGSGACNGLSDDVELRPFG